MWGKMAYCGGLATRLLLARACESVGPFRRRKAECHSAAGFHPALQKAHYRLAYTAGSENQQYRD